MHPTRLRPRYLRGPPVLDRLVTKGRCQDQMMLRLYIVCIIIHSICMFFLSIGDRLSCHPTRLRPSRLRGRPVLDRLVAKGRCKGQIMLRLYIVSIIIPAICMLFQFIGDRIPSDSIRLWPSRLRGPPVLDRLVTKGRCQGQMMLRLYLVSIITKTNCLIKKTTFR